MLDHARYRSIRVFSSLDGLRCAAVVAVVFHHAPGSLSVGRLGHMGFLGVDLFFVLSGFLIVTLLLREHERNGAISLRAFYARRALRIFPLYYAVLGACALLFATVFRHGSQADAFFRELPRCALYLTNWLPATTMLAITWSLSAEEQFYAVWPPLEKLLGHRTLLVLVVLIAASQAIAFGWADGWLARWPGWSPTEPIMLRQVTFTPILLGVLLAHLLHRARSFAVLARALGKPYVPLAIALALVAFLLQTPDDVSGWPRFTVHLLMTAWLASCVVQTSHWLSGVLSWPPIARVGVVSYGVYLLHPFAMDAARRVIERGLVPAAAMFPLTLAGAVGLAELSHRFYERPILRRKARFAR